MKLDYLQFLELEVFTRFGASLEASMEAVIRRGRILRSILKQDRLSPVAATSQLAWLIAFNDGLLREIDADALPRVLEQLAQATRQSTLNLDSPREEWRAAIAGWLAAAAGAEPDEPSA